MIEAPITDQDLEHWAFLPLKRVKPPQLKYSQAAQNEIDRFIIAKLEEKNLDLAPKADPATLIRRVSYDLTGLPPEVDDVVWFSRDPSPENYARYVDQLLASTAYGERWAQHWLELARFAETDGFEHDKERKDAWKYRDWVIQALNRDLPLNEFIRYQLAGDEEAGNDWAELGTGFLLAGPDMPDINSQEERRNMILNEITSTIGTSLLGVTMNCAQCHDHPYDPISHADFYRLRAFFANAVFPSAGKQLGMVMSEPGPRPPRTYVMRNGDYRETGPEIAPWFLRIANPNHVPPKPLLETMKARSSGRRTELAEWITRENSQLFLRSMANRLWLHHFNQPLVSTPGDFGKQGGTPSHPELLDWLATEIPKQGWSMKAMHRLMVSSATYQQSSMAEFSYIDEKNQLMSHFQRARLSGEMIRDTLLEVSEHLEDREDGPSDHLALPKEVQSTLLKKHARPEAKLAEQKHRSIYAFARRNQRFPLFEAFDRPDGQASSQMRSESITPMQSLILMNSEFTRETAADIADLILERVGEDTASCIDMATWRILGRDPSDEEMELGQCFLGYHGEIAGSHHAALSDYCLALFNSNSFLYVE